MPLKLKGMPNIFPHGKSFSSGGGKIRAGQATIVVAQDGSGDTDDIQTGVNMILSGGGVVYIKKGTYTITESILIKNNNTSIIGTGRGTQITTATANITLIDGNEKDYLYISNLYLKGEETHSATADGILIDGDFCIVENCWIEKMGSAGIASYGSQYVIIRGNIVTECQRTGIILSVISLGNSDCVITSNICADNGEQGAANWAGILVSGITASDFHTVVGNRCTGNPKGIWLTSATDRICCTGNNCYGNDGDNIDNDGTNNILSGNVTA